MPNDTVTMLGPDGGTYLVPKANHATALQAGMKTAPLAQQAMPPQPSLSMKRQEFLRQWAPNLTPEAIGEANKTAAIAGASLLPIGATEGAAVTKGLPWVARQAAERIPSAYGGYEAGSAATKRLSSDTGIKVPPVVGGAAGAAAGFFAPELVKGAVNKAVPLVEKLGAAWRGAGKAAGAATEEASSLIRPGRGSAGDWASVPKENLWEYAVNPKYEGSEMQAGARRELERSGLSKTPDVPLRDKVAGAASAEPAASVTPQPRENQVAELRQQQNNQALRNMRKQNTLKTFSGALEEGRKHAKATGAIK